MTVQALIQAAGAGSRLGLGPKAFVRLDGVTLLERAVATARQVASGIVVAAPPTMVPEAEALVGRAGVTVIAGAPSRSATTRRLVEAATAPWLLLHDVVHPLVSVEEMAAVVAAARRYGAAAPGIANTEFLYSLAGDLLHPPGAVLVGQKPVAFARPPVAALYARPSPRPGAEDPSFLALLEQAGIPARFVPGSRRNVKITDADDLRIAAALIALDRGAP